MAGSDTAETLRDLSRRISTHTGQRLVILTTKSPLPCANLDDRVEVIIKNTMSRLYDLNTRVMDLSNFRQSDEFKQHGLFITIGKANILRTVVEIIVSNTPNLRALNFANNRMNFLEQLRPLSEKCPELMGIDLSKNKVCFCLYLCNQFAFIYHLPSQLRYIHLMKFATWKVLNLLN